MVDTNRFSFKITALFESVGVLVNQSMVPGVGVGVCVVLDTLICVYNYIWFWEGKSLWKRLPWPICLYLSCVCVCVVQVCKCVRAEEKNNS